MGNKRSRVTGEISSCNRTTAESSRHVSTTKPVDGRMTRMKSRMVLCTRNLNDGLKVVSSEKPALSWRWGNGNEGDPSHELSDGTGGCPASGERDRHPIRQLSAMTEPGGSRALLPMKERFPIVFRAIITFPSRTRAAPSETLSAMTLSSPMASKSGEINEAVETSALAPNLAPSNRYQGAR